MCLIVLAYKISNEFPFILLANRDEFYDRPALPMYVWEEDFLAGKDLRGEGTWMGFGRNGRFAAITNYREGIKENTQSPSRGELVKSFLKDKKETKSFRDQLHRDGHLFNGFNLIYGNTNEIYYYSNRGEEKVLNPGIYGLSNHLLDTPWPKVELAKKRTKAIIENGLDKNRALELLHDEGRPSDMELPKTGVSLETEKLLSSIFIRGTNYGTRCSTIAYSNGTAMLNVIEKTYFPDGASDEKSFEFKF